MLVGNKTDLDDVRQVGAQQGREYADTNQMEFIETSAPDGANVTESFTRLATGIVQWVMSVKIVQTIKPPLNKEQNQNQEVQQFHKEGCCW